MDLKKRHRISVYQGWEVPSFSTIQDISTRIQIMDLVLDSKLIYRKGKKITPHFSSKIFWWLFLLITALFWLKSKKWENQSMIINLGYLLLVEETVFQDF